MENKDLKQTPCQQLQHNVSFTVDSDESHPCNFWKGTQPDNERKSIETWWTSQLQMSI